MLARRTSIAAILTVILIAVSEPAARADTIRDSQWILGYLKIPEVHRISHGEGVTLGLADSGVDDSSPDLVGAVAASIDFVDPDRKGGYDPIGHGTAMAGIIAGRGHGPGDGILGIAPKATVLDARSIGDLEPNNERTVRAIDWLVAHHAKVICIASGSEFGGPVGNGPDNTPYGRALKAALDSDVVVVAAAGNRPETSRVNYPAKHAGILAVGGIDQAGRHAEISVSGPEIALVAPAENIVSTAPVRRYVTSSGTSNSAAIVAGAAALVRAKYPTLSAPEVIHRLTATAHDAGPPGRDDDYGYGIIDIVKALTADVPPLPSSSSSAEATTRKPANQTSVALAVAGVLALLIAAGVAAGVTYARRRA